jgi:catechol 2,3-dioxygenase-like lactoylglutathione lyase family enzyme
MSEKTADMNHEIYPMPAFPTLSASDLAVSLRFYVDGLGFQHIFSMPDSEGQPILHHIRFARYADLLLEQEPPGSEPGAESRGRGVRLTFSLPLAERTADEVARRAKRLGALIEGPVERPWNTRDLVVADPDGYVLVFTEPLDLGKTMDQVLKDVAGGQ